MTKQVNCAGSPANTADSNSKGLIRGGTVNILLSLNVNKVKIFIKYIQV